MRLETELAATKREAQGSIDTLRAQLAQSEDAVPRMARQMRTLQDELHELRARVDVLRAVSLPVAEPSATREPLSPRRPLPAVSSTGALASAGVSDYAAGGSSSARPLSPLQQPQSQQPPLIAASSPRYNPLSAAPSRPSPAQPAAAECAVDVRDSNRG